MEDVTGNKVMALRYTGSCRVCGSALPARTRAVYERATKTVRCLECPTTAPHTPSGHTTLTEPHEPVPTLKPPVDRGRAGSSAWREYERRKARDKERLRQRWGRLGGLAVALADERQSTAAWARGAIGEARLGARLDSIASDTVVVLHDRRIPRSRANIDHLVITPGGVWVVDAKRYKGRPHLRLEGGLLRPRVEKLYVGSRNCTTLVDGVLKQVELVRSIVGQDVPVHGALCFVDADWPLIGGAFSTRGVRVLWPKKLVQQILAGTGTNDSTLVAEALDRALPLA